MQSLARTHSKEEFPIGFKMVRHEVPLDTTVHELQSGANTANPKGARDRTAKMASLNLETTYPLT